MNIMGNQQKQQHAWAGLVFPYTQANLITENAQAVTAITQAIQQQYSSLEKQHQDFVAHLNLQLATAQQQLQVLMSQSGG